MQTLTYKIMSKCIFESSTMQFHKKGICPGTLHTECCLVSLSDARGICPGKITEGCLVNSFSHCADHCNSWKDTSPAVKSCVGWRSLQRLAFLCLYWGCSWNSWCILPPLISAAKDPTVTWYGWIRLQGNNLLSWMAKINDDEQRHYTWLQIAEIILYSLCQGDNNSMKDNNN